MNTDPSGLYRDRLLRLLAASIKRGDVFTVATISTRLGLRPDQPKWSNRTPRLITRWMNEDLS